MLSCQRMPKKNALAYFGRASVMKKKLNNIVTEHWKIVDTFNPGMGEPFSKICLPLLLCRRINFWKYFLFWQPLSLFFRSSRSFSVAEVAEVLPGTKLATGIWIPIRYTYLGSLWATTLNNIVSIDNVVTLKELKLVSINFYGV